MDAGEAERFEGIDTVTLDMNEPAIAAKELPMQNRVANIASLQAKETSIVLNWGHIQGRGVCLQVL